MATASTGWKCTHSASIISSTETTATVKVTCYWQNDGWKYDINYVSAWVYCNGQSVQVKSSGSIDAQSSNSQSVSCGSATFTINKTTSTQSISCYAKITSNSSYVSGTKKSTATTVSVPAKSTYTVKYNANGGSGAPSSQTKSHGASITLSTTKPTRSGYTFSKWNTASGGGGTSYSAGATYSANASTTLYAQWTANKYTVTYNANGGSGAPSSQTKTHGVDLTLSTTKPTRSGYNFVGWSTSSSATSANYSSGATYTKNAALTLYAVWAIGYTEPRITNVKLYRCDVSSGVTFNDEGEHFVIYFDWATDVSNPTYKIEWKKVTQTWDEAISATRSLSGTSGTNASYYTPSAVISLENTYDIRLTITDSSGSTSVLKTLYGYKIALDFTPGFENLLQNSDFGSAPSSYWVISSGVTFEAAEENNTSYGHLETTKAGSSSYRVYYNTGYFKHTSGKTYTLTFDARSSVDGTVLVSNVAGSYNAKTYSLSLDWQRYSYTYTAGTSGNLTLWLSTANTDADITNIMLVEGSGEANIGVAIGKTAEISGMLDVGFPSTLRKNVYIGNKRGWNDGNTGIYMNAEGYMQLQRSSANGYYPYIGLYIDDEDDARALLRYNHNNDFMEFYNAGGYRFNNELYVNGNIITGNKLLNLAVTNTNNNAYNYGNNGYLDGQTGVYINKAGYMHLQRANVSGEHPYIGFIVGANTSTDGAIRVNNSTGWMEFLDADAYRVDAPFYVGASKTAYNDGVNGWYFGTDGTAHITGGYPGLFFHYQNSSSYTSYIYEGASGILTLSKNLNVISGIAAGGNIVTDGNIRIGDGDSSSQSARALNTYWNDGAVHNLVERYADGLTSAFGWAGKDNYLTTTIIRGKSCKLGSATGSTITSDERLKKDFCELSKWDAFYKNIEPCAFKMKDGSSGRYHIGFKAQQIEQSLLDAGLTTQDFGGFIKMNYQPSTDEDPTTLAVHEEAGINPGDVEYGLIYTEFVALNTYKIQQLQAENAQLQEKVAGLEERLAKLEALLGQQE